MALNFWLYPDTNQNSLKGTDTFDEETQQWIPDIDNPAVLPRDYILEMLQSNKIARMGYNDLRNEPIWTEAEIARLDSIASFTATIAVDNQVDSDIFQSRMNRSPIYTTGRRGGGNF